MVQAETCGSLGTPAGGEAGPVSTDGVLLPGNLKDAAFPLGPPGPLEMGEVLVAKWVHDWVCFSLITVLSLLALLPFIEKLLF